MCIRRKERTFSGTPLIAHVLDKAADLTHRVCAELKERSWMTKRVVVKIKYVLTCMEDK